VIVPVIVVRRLHIEAFKGNANAIESSAEHGGMADQFKSPMRVMMTPTALLPA
jgi:hypothetical protein